MNVLIVQSRENLAKLWLGHLERNGFQVHWAADQESAIDWLSENEVDIIILDLVLADGAALAVADYTNYRQPDARVIFVTSTSFFSDGSIFAHAANARALVPADTSPEDLAAMVEHYGMDRQSAGN